MSVLRENCCGCTACSLLCPVNAIQMQENKEGFQEPVIDPGICIECGLCIKNCGFKNKLKNGIQKKEFPPQSYVIKRKNLEKRMQSQSGGAFAVMAEAFLQKKAVVYGVAQKADFTAHYKRIEDRDHLPLLRGSKYVQAEVNGIFHKVYEDLRNGKEVFFGGTPCCVDGLYQYLKAKKCNIEGLTTYDLICHGVPSPKIFKHYMEYLAHKYGAKVQKFNYRDKRLGWHGHSESFQFSNRRETFVSRNYVNIFYSHLPLRESCYECPYATLERVSDITIGDCWGIEKVIPKMDDPYGNSLVIIHSKKGEEVFQRIKAEILYQPINIQDVLQPNLIHPTDKPGKRKEFWESYFTHGFLKTVEQYCGFDQHGERVFHRFKNKLRLMKERAARIIRR